MKSLDSFIKHLEEEVANHSIYVWGAQGQSGSTITEAWIRKRETSETNANRAIAYWKKQVAAGFGDVLKAFDCSGLGMAFLQNETGIVGSDMNAQGMRGKCAEIKKADLRRGDWVFKCNSEGRATHIGYVVDDSLNVIEAKGRDYGVTKSPLKKGRWNAYGRPRYFKEEIEAGGGAAEEQKPQAEKESPKEQMTASDLVVSRVLKQEYPALRGDDVMALQKALIAAGYGCGKCGADGIFGNMTRLAVRAFQGDRRLIVDGKAGVQTITALGGTWNG